MYFCIAAEEGEIQNAAGLESCLLRALNKQKPVHEHVDISVKLAGMGLLEHIPSEVWPPMNAVRELNSKIKSMQKAGQEVAFVAVDLCKSACVFVPCVCVGHCALLHRFLPSGCREHVHVNLEEDDNGKRSDIGKGNSDTGKRSKKRLDLAMWQLAWDRCDFAYGAVAHWSCKLLQVYCGRCGP